MTLTSGLDQKSGWNQGLDFSKVGDKHAPGDWEQILFDVEGTSGSLELRTEIAQRERLAKQPEEKATLSNNWRRPGGQHKIR